MERIRRAGEEKEGRGQKSERQEKRLKRLYLTIRFLVQIILLPNHKFTTTRIAPALFGPRRTLKISIYVHN